MTPQREGYFQPAEWAPHESVWLAWPSAADLWEENLGAAQAEFVALCRAICDFDEKLGAHQGERLDVLVPTPEAYTAAKKALSGLPVQFHSVPFGDIWMRDIAPLFLKGRDGKLATVRFKFNGWGGKYVLPHDDLVASRVAELVALPSFAFSWVLEGGSVDVDGEGTCLTTRQCLLNPNRNPGMTQDQVEEGLKQSLGVSKVLWLGDGLLNDHTDGHIDTIARFVAPGVVVCMKATTPDDPNRDVLEQIAQDLESFTDARGRKLKVVRIPSPGNLTDEDGEVIPASYVNFYIGNSTVVVPTYGSQHDEAAVRAIAELFPGHRVVGSSASAILSGGGAFHCISQQQPKEGV